MMASGVALARSKKLLTTLAEIRGWSASRMRAPEIDLPEEGGKVERVAMPRASELDMPAANVGLTHTCARPGGSTPSICAADAPRTTITGSAELAEAASTA